MGCSGKTLGSSEQLDIHLAPTDKGNPSWLGSESQLVP